MTKPDHPTRVRPEVRPNLVPKAAPGIADSTSSPVPISSIGDEVEQPARPRPGTSSRPWFAHNQIEWHYPDPEHPSSRDFPRASQTRSVPCALCGAPPGARCATKTGRPAFDNHKLRARAAHHPSTAPSTDTTRSTT